MYMKELITIQAKGSRLNSTKKIRADHDENTPSKPVAMPAHAAGSDRRQPQIDEDDQHHGDGGEIGHRRGIADVVILEGLIVDIIAQYVGGVRRAAPGQHVDDVVDSEGAQGTQHQSHQNGGSEHGQRDRKRTA